MEVPRRFTLDGKSTVGSSVEAIQPTKILKNNKSVLVNKHLLVSSAMDERVFCS